MLGSKHRSSAGWACHVGVSPPSHNPPGLGVCPPAAPSLMLLFDGIQRGTGACRFKERVPGTAEAPECRLWKLGRGHRWGVLSCPSGGFSSVQFSSFQLLSCVRLFETPLTAAPQAFLSITNSRSLLKLMSIESVMPSNHLILCHPLVLLPSIFSSIRRVTIAKKQ